MATTPICAVCAKSGIKYKCSTCKTPSCSLTCYKRHQIDCSSLPIPVTKPVVVPQSEAQLPEDGITAGVSKQDLDVLFERYPGLRLTLQNIYMSSCNLREDSEPRRDRHTSSDRFKKGDTEFDAGLRSLQQILERGDSTSDGVEAFMRLLADKTAS